MNENPEPLILGKVGEKLFCSECQQYDKCNHDRQKILQCNKDIITYAYEIEKGFKSYVWEGNFEHQPKWWVELLWLAQRTINEARNDRKARN